MGGLKVEEAIYPESPFPLEPLENPSKAVDPETIEATVQRVVAIGQRLLASDPSHYFKNYSSQFSKSKC